jgi:hypothetical protein
VYGVKGYLGVNIMSDNDEWQFFGKNAQGHDIDVQGYDKYGHFRGNFSDPPSNNNKWNTWTGSKGGSSELLFLIAIVGIGFIIERYGDIILAIIISCGLLIIAFFIFRKIRNKSSNQSNDKFARFTGKSTESFSDDAVYEGDFVNGCWHGKGKVISADGVVYEGDFVKGTPHGKGKMIYINGDVYEGDFVESAPQGKGKYTQAQANGFVYEGDFVEDERHGKGKIIYINGDVYEGDFVKGKCHGKGKATWAEDGCIYEGDYVEGIRHGKGKLIWLDGSVYEGDFFNDNFHGKGKLTSADGTIKEGNFKDGEFIE